VRIKRVSVLELQSRLNYKLFTMTSQGDKCFAYESRALVLVLRLYSVRSIISAPVSVENAGAASAVWGWFG
jgi:hypothetical protein